jgi:hypothetical protein
MDITESSAPIYQGSRRHSRGTLRLPRAPLCVSRGSGIRRPHRRRRRGEGSLLPVPPLQRRREHLTVPGLSDCGLPVHRTFTAPAHDLGPLGQTYGLCICVLSTAHDMFSLSLQVVGKKRK